LDFRIKFFHELLKNQSFGGMGGQVMVFGTFHSRSFQYFNMILCFVRLDVKKSAPLGVVLFGN